jgi:hypothetical protein
MFSICIKGIWLVLNFIVAAPLCDWVARLASLQSATPSFSASRRLPGGRAAERAVSIHVRASEAAWGV